MVMIRFLPFVMLMSLLSIYEVRSSNFEEPILPSSFANRLVPAETRFIERCERYIEEKVDWEDTRKVLYLNSQRELVTFRNLATSWTGLNLGSLEELNIAELHQQYAELYNLLNQPTPTKFVADQPEEKTQSRSSPPSSTVVSDPHSEEEDTEDDDDSQNSGTPTPPASSTLRHRHSPPHS